MDKVTISPAIEKFLKQPNMMVLGTLRHDNSIQMTVVWYEYKEGKFLVSTVSSRAKYKNIDRDNRVTFVIYNDKNPYQYIQVRGTAEMTREGGHELIDNLSQHYKGQTPYAGDPDHKEDRVVITITPEDMTSAGFSSD